MLGDKRTLQVLLWALMPIWSLRETIPLPYVMAFLTVALDEGKSIGAYAKELNATRFTMGRCMSSIGEHGRNGRAGLGLVTIKRPQGRPNPTEVFLTHKGREVAGQVLHRLRRLRKSYVLN